MNQVCATDIGKEGLNTNCAWQESQLAVLWTIGVFALNFGPVIVGPVLDYVGPKITAMLGENTSPCEHQYIFILPQFICTYVLGRPAWQARSVKHPHEARTSKMPTLAILISCCCSSSLKLHKEACNHPLTRSILRLRPGTLLNMVGLILLGCSNTHDFNGLPAGAIILGLAGITFHLSQLHISNLFPRSRGFISSLLVAGFTGCGVIFYLLDLIFKSAGSTRCDLFYCWAYLNCSHAGAFRCVLGM